MQRPPRLLLATPLVALLGLGACQQGLDEPKPTPPNMTAVVAAYEAPSAPLDQDTAPLLEQAVSKQLGPIHDLCGWAHTAAADLCDDVVGCPDCSFVDELLAPFDALAAATDPDGTDGSADGTPSVGGVPLEGEGWVQVTRICGGHGAAPVADADANGTMTLTFGFTEGGLDRVLWGRFSACRMLLGDQPIELDAGFNLDVGPLEWFADYASARLVFEIFGALTVADVTTEIAVDFQLEPDQAGLAFRLDLGDDLHVNYLLRTDGAGFRAANGDWTCDFAARTCDTATGQHVSW